MVKSTMSSLKLVCILILLGSFLSCVEENSVEKSDNMCPSDGANLYIKCADGREKVFGIGYGDKPIFVRRKGKWILEGVDKFCTSDIIQILFYFRKGHLRLSGRMSQGTWKSIWRTAHGDCITFDHKIGLHYFDLKIESIPATTSKPEESNN